MEKNIEPRKPELPKRKIAKYEPSGVRKAKDPWFLVDIENMVDNKYGKSSILLKHISVKDSKEMIISGERFLVECGICSYIWTSCIDWLNTGSKGCPWCKNKCAYIKSYDLYTVNFIGQKLYNGKYQYIDFNKDENIIDSKTEINIWCGIEGHEIFQEVIGKHLTKSERQRPKGCLECFKNEKVDEDKRKRYTLDVLIRRSRRIHKDSYDFSLVEKEDVKDAYSTVKIICKKCENSFPQVINDHINNKSRCPYCYGSFNYTREKFINEMNKRYTNNDFEYDLIKEEDITCKTSKPKVKCAECGYVIENTIVGDFLHCPFKKECDACNNHIPWTKTRLYKYFEEREKQGKYFYPRLEYSNLTTQTVIKINCLICKNKGYERFEFKHSIGNHFYCNFGCHRCSGKLPWDYTKFKEELPPCFLDNYEYDLIEEDMIKGGDSLIPIKCNQCSRKFERTVYDHIKEMRGCTFCPKPSGERVAQMYLEELRINFKDQVCVKGPNGYSCFYDFEIYQDENIILELDGGLHFKRDPHFHKTEEQFLNARERDIYKHYSALKNGKKIIRIEYYRPNKIIEHIDKGLACEEREYFSEPSKYDWLIDGVQKLMENS